MTRHYPELGRASDWSCRVGNLIQSIRSTTQIWIVTRHQYGISALVSNYRRVWGLVEMTCGLVHTRYSLPEWQAVKLTFFAPCKAGLLNEFITFQLKFLSILKICYGGDVPTCYYRKECGKVSSLKEESCQVSCVKRGTALKLNYEVKAPGSILR